MLHTILYTIGSLLVSTPYQNGIVGIQISLPDQAQVAGVSLQPPFCIISSGNSSIKWDLRIEKKPTKVGVSPKQFILDAIQSVESPKGTVVLSQSEMVVGSQNGWWHLLHHSNQEEQSIIGRLALQAPGQQMIMATVVTNLEGWRYGQEQILRTLQSIVPLDPAVLLAKKINSLNAATALLDALHEDILKPLDGFQEWRRIQAIEVDGSLRDIGYAYVAVELGSMQDIESTTHKIDEPPTGIIVTYQSRIVPNLETGVVSDTDAKYWMSWDGEDERWTSRTTGWLDKINATVSETGLRNRPQLGMPKSTLLVVSQDLTKSLVEPPFEYKIIDPWFPRAITWIPGLILANAKTDTTYRWWCYDNIDKQQILTRIDSVVAHQNETTTLTTQFGEGAASATATFDRHGRLIQQTIQNRAVITGSTKDQIHKIWSPFNL
jgi:hypothetical protein